MVNEVGKIIRNTLLAYGAVHLPSVGTLYIVRKGAKIVGKGRVAAPEYRVEYASSREAKSVVDAIAECASVSMKQAEDIYMLWLDKARKDSVVEIFSVGVLRNKSLIVEEEFIRAINPDDAVITITKHRRKYGRVALYITAAVAIVAVVVGCCMYIFANGDNANVATERNSSTTPAIADNGSGDYPATTISTDDLYNTHEITEAQDAELYFSEVNDVVEDVVVDNRPWMDRDDIAHYVICGSYSRKRNAEREVAHINSRGLDGVVSKTILRGKMYSIAIYGSTTLEDCEAFIAEHKTEFPQAWVYSIEEN